LYPRLPAKSRPDLSLLMFGYLDQYPGFNFRFTDNLRHSKSQAGISAHGQVFSDSPSPLVLVLVPATIKQISSTNLAAFSDLLELE